MSHIASSNIAGVPQVKERRILTTPSPLTSDGASEVIGPINSGCVLLINVGGVPSTSITVQRGSSATSILNGNITMIEESTGNKVTAITATGNYIISPEAGYPSFGPYFKLVQNGTGVSVFTAAIEYPLGN